MADSLTLQIGVDTTQLTAKLAQAQADVRAYGAEVRRLADQLRAAGSDATLQAQLERVSGQLARAQAAAASFRGELRGHKAEVEGLGAKLGELGNVAKELAGAFGIGFGVERLVEGVKTIAELGEHTVNTAHAVGLTTEQYSTLAQSLKLVGGNADLATRSLIQNARKAEEALSNPASKAREAYLALGATIKDIEAGRTEAGSVDLLAKISGTKLTGRDRVAALTELFGTKGLQQIDPYLSGGPEKIRQLAAEAKATGSVIDEEIGEKLEGIAHKINTLGEAFEGLGIRIVTELRDPLVASLDAATRLIELIKGSDVSDFLSIGQFKKRAEDFGHDAEWAKLKWQDFARFWDDLQEKLGHGRPSGTTRTALATPEGTRQAEHESATRHEPPQTFEEFYGQAPAAGGKGLVDPGQEQKKLAGEIKLVTDWLKLEEAALDDSIAKAGHNEAEVERLSRAKIAAAQNARAAEQAVRESYAAGAEARGNDALAEQYRSGGEGLRAREFELDKQRVELERKFAEQKISTAISGMEGQRKVIDQAESADIASVERRRQSNQVTADAAAAAEIQIVEAHRRAAEQILAREEELAQGQVKLLQEIANRRAELEQQSDDKIGAIKEKADDENRARAEKIDQEIAGSLASAIMGAASGKESIGQAIQKIIRQEETKVLEGGIKQLLGASGVGEAIDKAEQGLFGFLPGGKKTETTGPEHLAAAAQKSAGEVERLGDAAAGAAGKISGGGGTQPSPAAAGGSPAPASTPPGAGAGGTLPPGGEKYAGLISAAAQKHGVPEAVLYNLLGAESSFNPQAGPSSAGGRGLAQFIPSTAAEYGVDVTSPESSIEGAARYLEVLYAKHGNWAGALGEYSNQGPGLGIYAAEKNAWGPALVAAAHAADLGGAGTQAALQLPEVPHYPAFAGGTDSTPPGTIMVGEKGPELLTQGGGLGVVPADQTSDLVAAWQDRRAGKIGPGPETAAEALIRNVIGAEDIGNAITGAKQTLAHLQRGESWEAIGTAGGALASGAMVFGGLIGPEGKLGEVIASEGKIAGAVAGAARLDKFGRTLRDLAIAIPPETRRVGPFEAALGTKPVAGGADWLHLDPTQLGSGLHLTQAENQAAFDRAIADTIAGAKEKGPELAQRIAEFREAYPTFGAPSAEFWDRALSLPDRARYWYEISARKVQQEGLAGDVEGQRRTFDMLAATSPREEPDPNLRRALGALAEHAQGLPTDVDLMNQVSARQALSPEGLEGLKTGSFSGTFQHIAGLTETPPLSVNDRQVASFMGLDDEKAFARKRDSWLYEATSRYLQNLRDAENAARPGVAAGTENPLETWQLQAVGWVHQRALKNPAKAAVEAYDDYALAADRLKGELSAAGIDVSEGLFSQKVLRDPRVQNLLSTTREQFQKTPIATVEVASKQTAEGARARSIADQIGALPPGTLGLTNALSQLEAIDRRTMTALAISKKGEPSLIDRLVSSVVGRKVDVSRIDTGGSGTFEGAVSPNMRIPLGGRGSAGYVELTKEQREGLLAGLGQALNQDAMAATRFTTVEPGQGHTFSLFVPETGAGVTPEQIKAFEAAVGGKPLNVSRTATGTLLDINTFGGEAATLQQVKAAAETIFEAGGAAETTIFHRDYQQDLIFAEDYEAKIAALKGGARGQDRNAGGRAGARNPGFRAGDWDAALGEIRGVAADRDRDYAAWAERYGPALERSQARGARAGPLSREFPAPPETLPLAADEPPASFLPAPSLKAAINVGGKIYTGADHAAAAATLPPAQARLLERYPDRFGTTNAAGQFFDTSHGFVTESGEFLDRLQAKKYALEHGLLDPNAADWSRRADTPLIHDDLRGAAETEDILDRLHRARFGQVAAQLDQLLPEAQSSRSLTLEEIAKNNPGLAQHIAEQALSTARVKSYESDLGDRWALTPAELAARDRGAAQLVARELVFHTHPDLVSDEMIRAAGWDRESWRDQVAIYGGSRRGVALPMVRWDPTGKTWVIIGAGGAAAAGAASQAQAAPGLAEGGPVETTGLATVHAGESVAPVGWFEQIGRDIADFLANPLQHAFGQLSSIVGGTSTPRPAPLPPAYAGYSDDEVRRLLAQQVTAPIPPAPPAPDLAAGGAIGDAVHGANTDLVAALDPNTQALKDLTTAVQRDTSKPASSTAPASGSGSGSATGTDDSSGGNSFLSGLLGLGAIGGLVAVLGGRRTAGTPATVTPRTVWTSGGITSEAPGHATPALVPANPQPSRWGTIAGELLGGVAVLSALSKLFGGSKASGTSNFQGTGLSAADVAAVSPNSQQALQAYNAAGGASEASGATGSLVGNLTQLSSAVGKVIPGFSGLASTISSVVGGFGSLLGSIGSIAGGVGKAASGGGGLFGFFGSLFGAAGGTSSTPSGPILVGERGPEIITQPGGLQVLPAGLTSAILGGAPGFAEGTFAARIAATTPGPGWTIPAAPAPSVLSPDFAGSGLAATAAAAGGSGPVAGHQAGAASPISVNIVAFDAHDVRRALTSQAGRAAIAEAFARERRGNSRHYLSDG